MKHRSLWISTALALALTVTASANSDAVGLTNVAYHTADEILTLYHLLNLDQDVSLTYTIQPDLDNLSTSGTPSDAVLQNALNTLNFARYIAGLSYDVSLSDTYNQYSQDAALALASLGGGPVHYFDQTSQMSDSFYASASQGAKRGNLSAGIDDLSINIIHGWLSDEGENNLYTLGHRRYALAPIMEETGFGIVEADKSASYGTYTAMSVMDSTADDTVGVCWPAQTMPVEYFESNYPWSFIVGSPVSVNTSVTVTRQNDGQTWTMVDDFINGPTGDGFITINNDYYCQPGCIIFMPDDITYHAGDVYDVEISYTSTAHNTANYTVTFISLDDDYTPQAHVTAYNTDYNTPDTTTDVPEITEPATTVDISGASAWAQDELTAALDAGYPVGVYADKFQQAMTRGEFAHMLGLFCENKWTISGDYSSTAFTDLGNDPADAERNKYIILLNQWGVINGVSDTSFDPDATLTREAIAQLLYGVQNLTLNPNVTQDISSFGDASAVSSWAVTAVRYMNQIGVLNGTSGNLLNPQGNVTVQEAALMCYRFFS